MAYGAILASSIIIDTCSLGYPGVGLEEFQIDSFLGLTGILPIIYLLILGTIEDVLLVIRLRISTPKSRIRYVATAISTTVTRYKKSWIWSLVGLWFIFHGLLCFIPSPIPTGIIFPYPYGTFFGLYGVGNFFDSVKAGEDRIKWLFFGICVSLVLGFDIVITNGFLVATIPALYLVAYKFKRNDQDFITAYFPRWMNFRARRFPQEEARQNRV